MNISLISSAAWWAFLGVQYPWLVNTSYNSSPLSANIIFCFCQRFQTAISSELMRNLQKNQLRCEETHVATDQTDKCNLSIFNKRNHKPTTTTGNTTDNKTGGEKRRVVIVLWTIWTVSTTSVSRPTLRVVALRWHDISSISALQGNKRYNKQMTAIVFVKIGMFFTWMRGCVALSTSPLYPSPIICANSTSFSRSAFSLIIIFISASLFSTQPHTQLITQC